MTPVLVDKYQRTIEYVRVSVTDRCNLRCFYCIPRDFNDFISKDNVLSDQDILTIIKAFIAQGAGNIRITGGEPLIRPNIIDLLHRISALDGLKSLSLSTNGVLLKKYAQDLVSANLRSINVSLDSLDQERVIKNCNKDCLMQVLEGLDAIKSLGFKNIKINMVITNHVKEADIESMADFCRDQGFMLRLIETMPFADISDFTDIHVFLPKLIDRYSLVKSDEKHGFGPAMYYRNQDSGFALGLITPMSQHFCATCNRVRISCDGILHTCLGNEGSIDLKPYLYSSQETLQAAILNAVQSKPKEHVFLYHLQDADRFKIRHVMTTTGG